MASQQYLRAHPARLRLLGHQGSAFDARNGAAASRDGGADHHTFNDDAGIHHHSHHQQPPLGGSPQVQQDQRESASWDTRVTILMAETITVTIIVCTILACCLLSQRRKLDDSDALQAVADGSVRSRADNNISAMMSTRVSAPGSRDGRMRTDGNISNMISEDGRSRVDSNVREMMSARGGIAGSSVNGLSAGVLAASQPEDATNNEEPATNRTFGQVIISIPRALGNVIMYPLRALEACVNDWATADHDQAFLRQYIDRLEAEREAARENPDDREARLKEAFAKECMVWELDEENFISPDELIAYGVGEQDGILINENLNYKAIQDPDGVSYVLYILGKVNEVGLEREDAVKGKCVLLGLASEDVSGDVGTAKIKGIPEDDHDRDGQGEANEDVQNNGIKKKDKSEQAKDNDCRTLSGCGEGKEKEGAAADSLGEKAREVLGTEPAELSREAAMDKLLKESGGELEVVTEDSALTTSAPKEEESDTEPGGLPEEAVVDELVKDSVGELEVDTEDSVATASAPKESPEAAKDSPAPTLSGQKVPDAALIQNECSFSPSGKMIDQPETRSRSVSLPAELSSLVAKKTFDADSTPEYLYLNAYGKGRRRANTSSSKLSTNHLSALSSAESIESFLSVSTMPVESHKIPNKCAICLCDYVKGDVIVTSCNRDCHHAFHQECIVEWLIKMQEGTPCPCCRRTFVELDEHIPNDLSNSRGGAADSNNANGVVHDPEEAERLRRERRRQRIELEMRRG